MPGDNGVRKYIVPELITQFGEEQFMFETLNLNVSYSKEFEM